MANSINNKSTTVINNKTATLNKQNIASTSKQSIQYFDNKIASKIIENKRYNSAADVKQKQTNSALFHAAASSINPYPKKLNVSEINYVSITAAFIASLKEYPTLELLKNLDLVFHALTLPNSGFNEEDLKAFSASTVPLLEQLIHVRIDKLEAETIVNLKQIFEAFKKINYGNPAKDIYIALSNFLNSLQENKQDVAHGTHLFPMLSNMHTE